MENKEREDVSKKVPEKSPEKMYEIEDEQISAYVEEFKQRLNASLNPPRDFLSEEDWLEKIQPPKEGALHIQGFEDLILEMRVRSWIRNEIEKLEEEMWRQFLEKVSQEHGPGAGYFELHPTGMWFDARRYTKEKNEPEEKIAQWEEYLLETRGDVYLSLGERWRDIARKVIHQLGLEETLAAQFSDRILPLGSIGHGGSGDVYLAWHIHLQKKVALKIIPFRKKMDRQLFCREIRNLAALDHPHIIQIHHAGFSEGQGFLVMELMEGGSLSGLLDKENPLPIFASEGRKGAIDLMIAIADAVSVLHEKDPPIQHNDIKPSNILIDGEKVRLADFGISRMGKDDVEPEEFEIDIDEKGELVLVDTEKYITGTPCYMAPEKIVGKDPLDPKSDIYSMGVTFFQLLTGFLPIEDKDSEKMLEKVVDQAPVPLHAYRYDLHPELEELVMSMLQKKHEMRPTAREVFERLRRMKEAWEKDPMINQALEIKEGPGTHQMKLMMERRRWELEERANKDTVTHAGS